MLDTIGNSENLLLSELLGVFFSSCPQERGLDMICKPLTSVTGVIQKNGRDVCPELLTGVSSSP